MLIIHHRRNTLKLLAETHPRYGVEVDIRSDGSQLIVHHEPFKNAVGLEEWLQGYKHRLVILNTKEEGLESHLSDLMKKYGIQDFFFLDQSFPFLVKTAKEGENRCAVRVSEYESVETALNLAGRVRWVWVDMFTRFPLTKEDYDQLKTAKFRLCLVSPELQNHSVSMISELKKYLQANDISMDAVCTKSPELWER
ncbi:MAG: phosphatidylinositol-specific phospholipase C/glycerophosphodiester phosphodiesterase family protein [Cyanobacteria bacterium P01_D01_bin.105]